MNRVAPLLFALILTNYFLDRSGTHTVATGQDNGPNGLDAGVRDAGGPMEPDANKYTPGRIHYDPNDCMDPDADPAHYDEYGIFCPIPANNAAACASKACTASCKPNFVLIDDKCVVSMRYNDRALDPNKAYDDGDTTANDKYDPTCRLEILAPDQCPGAPLMLNHGLEIYTGSTRGGADNLQYLGKGELTANGPDTVFSVETTWTRTLRIRAQPIHDWDITLNFRPDCPMSIKDSYNYRDIQPTDMAEEIIIDINAKKRYTIMVSGWQSENFGEFRLELKGS